MDLNDLPIYTAGIFVESAKFVRWGILVGQKIYTPIRTETAIRYMANPNARPGVWIDIKCTIITNINNTHKCVIYGFLNLVDQIFILPDVEGKIFNKDDEEAAIDRLPIRPVRLIKIINDEKIKEIADLVIQQMGNKWLSKFRRKFL